MYNTQPLAVTIRVEYTALVGRHRILRNPRILDVVPAVCGACVQLYGGNADGAQHRRVIHLSLHVQYVAQSAFLPLFFRTFAPLVGDCLLPLDF
jgi:hypothetical protein